MLVDLRIGYCDTHAEELGWSLDLGFQPAVATRRIHTPVFDIELRLLAASHQVAVYLAQRDPARPAVEIRLCLETVACIPVQTTALPAATTRQLPRAAYRFESAARIAEPAEFADTVAELESRAEQGLVGRYPGAPGALTVVLASADSNSASWKTWHSYPQDRMIVATESRLELR